MSLTGRFADEISVGMSIKWTFAMMAQNAKGYGTYWIDDIDD